MFKGTQQIWTLALLCAAMLTLGACGGSGNQRTTPDWQPSDRAPSTAQHWWWNPVERDCEDTDDCESGESCQLLQLGTCPGCPQGEEVRACVSPDGSTSGGATQASRQ